MPATDHSAAATAVTEEMHDNSWSANLEGPEHASDPDRVIAEALAALEHTVPGNHVNLVTHGENGHPESYLYDALAAADGEVADLEWEYVERCGCGGHVVRVFVA